MQSRRVWLPIVDGPLPAPTVLAGAAVAEPGGRPVVAGDTCIAVGPEGGWTPEEVARAGDRVSPRPERPAGRDRRRRGGHADGGGAPVSGRAVEQPHTAPSRSASTSTSRSARRGATTARSPPGPTARTSSATTSLRCGPRSSARSRPAWPRRRACSWAAAPRRWCRRRSSPPCSRSIPLADGAEVTVECNPDDVTLELLETYVAAGVNRVSIGVQSMVPHVLAALGRTHDPANVERAVAAVRAAGLPTFNLDIIYGAAGETLADWRTTLERTLDLDPPHVSAYALTVEAGTPLADDPARHPDDDVQADEYELADDLLAAAGLANYEVSNWARPGHECRHNLLYWRQHDYRGVRVRRPLAPGRTALVEPAHAGALHRRGPRRPLDRGGRRDAGCRRPAHRGPAAVAAHACRGPRGGARRGRAARRRRARRRPLGAHAARPADGQRGVGALALIRG